DLLRGIAAASDADIRTRLEILRAEEGAPVTDRPALERARRAARDLERQAGGQSAGGRDQGTVGPLLAFAYPDRIGRARAGGDGRFALANGRGAAFGSPQALARRELIVAVDLDDRERDARILLAAPLERRDLTEHFAERLRWRESVRWRAGSRPGSKASRGASISRGCRSPQHCAPGSASLSSARWRSGRRRSSRCRATRAPASTITMRAHRPCR